MKIKISKFWCLAITLVVILSMVLVFAVPAAADVVTPGGRLYP